MGGGDARVIQFAKDLQKILRNAAGVPVYEREAPRNADESLAVEPPFVVYTCDMRAPQDEGGEFTADLLIDIWSMGGWAPCYAIAESLDDALNATAYAEQCGTICADRNGLVFNREPRDDSDPRIRRMSGQYLIRFNKL